MLRGIIRLARNPKVQKFAVWAAPIVMGWVLKKIDQKSTSQRQGKVSTPKK